MKHTTKRAIAEMRRWCQSKGIGFNEQLTSAFRDSDFYRETREQKKIFTTHNDVYFTADAQLGPTLDWEGQSIEEMELAVAEVILRINCNPRSSIDIARVIPLKGEKP